MQRRVTMSGEKGDHECREGLPCVQRRGTVVTVSDDVCRHEGLMMRPSLMCVSYGP